MDITEIQEFDPKTCNFESSMERLHDIEREFNAKLAEGSKCTKDFLERHGLTGQHYVYLEDVLRRIGFSEAAIAGYIRTHGNCRWGPNGFERGGYGDNNSLGKRLKSIKQ